MIATDKRFSEINKRIMDKLESIDWETTDGTTFYYVSDKIDYRLSSYSLRMDFKIDDIGNIKGFEMTYSEYKNIQLFYLEKVEQTRQDSLEIFLKCEPEIRRELNIEEILND